jgi:hypothetical protein
MLNKILHTCILLLFASMTATIHASDLPTKTFASTAYHYAIHYPADWKLMNEGKGVIVFKNIAKTSSLSLMNIQTIYTKKGGGKYATIKDLMDDFWSQVPMHTQDARFLERRPITLTGPDGTTLSGEQTLLTFKEGGQLYKQWQVMMVNKDGTLFQALAYRAIATNFDTYYSVAKAVFASWVIY